MSETPLRIVVGYDGSHDADLALRWAAGAVPTGSAAEIVVVIVEPPARRPLSGHRRVEEENAEAVRQHAEEVVGEVAARLPRATVTVEVRQGHVADELEAAAKEASMLVVGSRGHGALAGTLVGSVSQHLARSADVPVVVVREPHRPGQRRIFAGVDGSPASARALRFAWAHAERTGLELVAVHGYVPFSTYRGSLSGAITDDTELHLEAAEAEARRWVGEALDGLPTGSIEVEAITVSAGQLLVDCSRAGALVVVGTRSHSVPEQLLGSVAQQLLHHAECPVAVVR